VTNAPLGRALVLEHALGVVSCGECRGDHLVSGGTYYLVTIMTSHEMSAKTIIPWA
jgi:hypothetical protein